MFMLLHERAGVCLYQFVPLNQDFVASVVEIWINKAKHKDLSSVFAYGLEDHQSP